MRRCIPALLALSLLALIPMRAAAAPTFTCNAQAVAQTPYQVPDSSPPWVEFDGRIGCSGGTFYDIHVTVRGFVDGSQVFAYPQGCVVSPCRQSGVVVKSWGTHTYVTKVDGWYRLVDGGTQYPVDLATSSAWVGTR